MKLKMPVRKSHEGQPRNRVALLKTPVTQSFGTSLAFRHQSDVKFHANSIGTAH
jgi:hypothetical protein